MLSLGQLEEFSLSEEERAGVNTALEVGGETDSVPKVNSALGQEEMSLRCLAPVSLHLEEDGWNGEEHRDKRLPGFAFGKKPVQGRPFLSAWSQSCFWK